MSEPVASVVVPSRGGARRLPVLLAALARQDRSDFEVIVVLDGEIDDSRAVLAEWAAHVDFTLRYVSFAENQGRSAALNAGTRAARGSVIIRCDDDLEPAPRHVSGHVRRHQDSPHPVGVVGPCVNVLPENAYARVYGRPASRRALDGVLRAPEELSWRHWAGNVSLLRDTAERVGDYDERFRRYGWEDVDYGYRLRQASIPVVVAPELAAAHHMAATTTVIRCLRALHAGAARETFVSIHGSKMMQMPQNLARPWPLLVNSTATIVTERSLRVLGTVVDHLIRVLPAWVGEKLVALLVESAGVAGVRYPHRARAEF